MGQTGQVKRTDVAVLRRWPLRGTYLSVVEVKSLFDLPTRYLVIRTDSNGEVILSRHRSLKRAKAAAEKTSK